MSMSLGRAINTLGMINLHIKELHRQRDALLIAARAAKDVLDHPEQKSVAAWNAIEKLELAIDMVD